jgi:4-diphosphocytidyl-2-C-methyl-D-erythritol kinase
MTSIPAPAKINLALVVGPQREDGKHEVVTVLQHVDLCDRIALEPAGRLEVVGFPEDTLVRAALELLARRARVEPRWRVRIGKRIPVAAGLGGGSSDAAAALRLANATLARPLGADELEALAAELGADVPFFLRSGPHLGTGDGSSLEPLSLPQDFWVLLVLPAGEAKESTAAVYRRFDERGGAEGFAARREALRRALASARRAGDLAALPRNDLAQSGLAAELEGLGALRADVSGAGPAVYALFPERRGAAAAARTLHAAGRTWLTVPACYG